MERKINNTYNHILQFNPDVTSLEKAYQDFPLETRQFDAGDNNWTFNSFILDDAEEWRDNGNGTTHIVWNVLYDDKENEIGREIVSYYTLSAASIPYIDRIRRDDEEAKLYGEEFDSKICGFSALKIEMFAVDKKYQDIFFEQDDDDLPIAAWIMNNIIRFAKQLINDTVGFKALYLHSVPEAESFYCSNGFRPLEINMRPLYTVDSEFKPLYLPLREIHMCYEK